MGGGDFDAQITFDQPVTSFDILSTAPTWAATDGGGAIGGLSWSQTPGSDLGELFWNGTFTEPFTLVVPGAESSVFGVGGLVVRPGTYTD